MRVTLVLFLVLALVGVGIFTGLNFSQKQIPDSELKLSNLQEESPIYTIVRCDADTLKHSSIHSLELSADTVFGMVAFLGCEPKGSFYFQLPASRGATELLVRNPQIVIAVSKEGRVSKAMVSRSSGSRELDQEALRLVSQGESFVASDKGFEAQVTVNVGNTQR